MLRALIAFKESHKLTSLGCNKLSLNCVISVTFYFLYNAILSNLFNNGMIKLYNKINVSELMARLGA